MVLSQIHVREILMLKHVNNLAFSIFHCSTTFYWANKQKANEKETEDEDETEDDHEIEEENGTNNEIENVNGKGTAQDMIEITKMIKEIDN